MPTPVIELPEEELLTKLVGIFKVTEVSAHTGVETPQGVVTPSPQGSPLATVGTFQRGLRILEKVCTFLTNVTQKLEKPLDNLSDPCTCG